KIKICWFRNHITSSLSKSKTIKHE
ncbi:hypothetical protein ACTFIU_000013, partial [Dictyostelium citrinum]